ncbi:MAG: 2-C-methyl-D-erythritol 4-phosphate cytidylyltransferase [Planctomycetota bacterium]|nr:2-C-methyl-D-erythritol 4-phosphate cytidylyltransferase [Planctomycetota bacterium]
MTTSNDDEPGEASPQSSGDFVLEPHIARERPRAAVVIVAAGNSTRMAAGDASTGAAPTERKPSLLVNGRPILELTCELFDSIAEVAELILVAHPEDIATFEQWTVDKPALAKVRAIVPGGAERMDSVRSGVFWCSFDVDVIAIHDAARPLCDPAVVRSALEVAHQDGAALVAAPVHDTIKESEDGRTAARTLDRSRLWAAQTPQVFDARKLRELVARARDEGLAPTDDAALWERYVGPVPLVPSDRSNLKITTPVDLEIAAAILRGRAELKP